MINYVKTKKGEINYRKTVINAVEKKVDGIKFLKEINNDTLKNFGSRKAYYVDFVVRRIWREINKKSIGAPQNWKFVFENNKKMIVNITTNKKEAYELKKTKISSSEKKSNTKTKSPVSKPVILKKVTKTTAKKVKSPVSKPVEITPANLIEVEI